MADSLGIRLYEYQWLEYGKEFEIENNKIPKIRDISDSEFCFILRHRSGRTQQAVAEDVGICRYWFRLQETGNAECSRLLSYWENL